MKYNYFTTRRKRAGVIAGIMLTAFGASFVPTTGCGSSPEAQLVIALLRFFITRSAGGTVTDQNASLFIPPNSLAADTTMTVQPATGLPATPQGLVLIPNTAFTFGPAGTTFSPAATLTLSITSGQLPAQVGANTMALYMVSGGTWIPVTGSMFQTGNSNYSVTAPVQVVGTYAVFGQYVVVTTK